MSCYQSKHSKLQAFKYKDPLAADKFFVCDKSLKLCCRPNCDLGILKNINISSKTSTTANNPILSDNFMDNDNNNNYEFFNSYNDVLSNNYKLCQHCFPNLNKLSSILKNENFEIGRAHV